MLSAPDGATFNPDNRAYRRFCALIGEHFEVVGWTISDTDRPALTTLVDIHSGDAFSIALVDSVEEHEPHALLALTDTHELLAYGPFHGQSAAGAAAAPLALGNPAIAVTRPLALHDPTDPNIPDDLWKPFPPAVAPDPRARDRADEDGPFAAVLVDRPNRQVAVVGPLDNQETALAWRPDPAQSLVDHLVIPLRPAPAGDDNPTQP